MTQCPTPDQLIKHRDDYILHPDFIPCDQEATSYAFVPRFLMHRALTIRPAKALDRCNPPPIFPYEFESWGENKPLNNDPVQAEKDVQAFIRALHATRTDVDELRRPPPPECPRKDAVEVASTFSTQAALRPTPYDIQVTAQCFIVLELDHKMNWRFTPDAQGVTTKNYHHVDNFGLTFYNKTTGTFDKPAALTNHAVKNSDCQILYFAVARRRFDEQKFNFHIEFEWAGNKSMPLIFDPTVPNGGGASFP